MCSSITGKSGENLYYTKQMLLAVGDKYEVQIAKDRAADSKYGKSRPLQLIFRECVYGFPIVGFLFFCSSAHSRLI